MGESSKGKYSDTCLNTAFGQGTGPGHRRHLVADNHAAKGRSRRLGELWQKNVWPRTSVTKFETKDLQSVEIKTLEKVHNLEGRVDGLRGDPGKKPFEPELRGMGI